jgi:hypothetical protein
MTNQCVKGVIELEAQVFAECPDYTTLGLRTIEGELVEVFLSTRKVIAKPEQYRLGQVLTMVGGEWHFESCSVGVGEYRRFWPLVVEYDK